MFSRRRVQVLNGNTGAVADVALLIMPHSENRDSHTFPAGWISATIRNVRMACTSARALNALKGLHGPPCIYAFLASGGNVLYYDYAFMDPRSNGAWNTQLAIARDHG